MNDDESIESIEIGEIKGSKEYLESLEENTLYDLLTAEIDQYLNRVNRIKARDKAYREKNKEKIKVKQKAYRERNKGKIKASDKAYKDNNRDMINARRRERYKKNREKIKASDKANREKAAEMGGDKVIAGSPILIDASAFLTAQNSDKKQNPLLKKTVESNNSMYSSELGCMKNLPF